MPIDLEAALSAPPRTEELSWTERDVLLYHLSLGAGRSADPELSYTYEAGLQVLPTFAVVAGQGISAGARQTRGLALPGVQVDLSRLLHGGQGLTVHRALPASGRAVRSTRVVDVWDKGRSAVIVQESTVTSGDQLLWTSRMQIWARGEGGFGGGAGDPSPSSPPDRAPDMVLDIPTSPDQARLYRLNGDLNPLHIDPEFAADAGFDAPILHGLASYGMVGKAVVDEVLGGRATDLLAYDVRFAGTVRPGETIRAEVWRAGDELVLTASVPERGEALVLTHGRMVVS